MVFDIKVVIGDFRGLTRNIRSFSSLEEGCVAFEAYIYKTRHNHSIHYMLYPLKGHDVLD